MDFWILRSGTKKAIFPIVLKLSSICPLEPFAIFSMVLKPMLANEYKANFGNILSFVLKIVMWLSTTKSPSKSNKVTRPAVPTPVELIKISPFVISVRLK